VQSLSSRDAVPALEVGDGSAEPAGTGPAWSRLLLVGALALAAVAGWLFAGSGHKPGRAVASSPAPPPQTVAVGPLTVSVDYAWRATGPPAGGWEQKLGDFQAFSVGHGLRLWLARAPASDWTLVPAALRRALPRPLGPARDTRVAGYPAWRYGPIAPAGGTYDLLVIPTTQGVLLVGCPTAARARTCQTGVQAIAGARALAPTLDLAARMALPTVVATLNAARASAGDALTAARGPLAQARAAASLARAQAAAAGRLQPLLAPGRDQAAAALRRSARAYAALRDALRAQNRHRYAAARAEAAAADAAAARRLRALAARGS
jgi:hypothetical protein